MDTDTENDARWNERKVLQKSFNSMIVCSICKGYLIEATAITECLHTFCKSCLIKHLEDNDTCPTCEIVIHQSYPLNYLRLDRALQNIVYALIPDLQKNEITREKSFYTQRGLPYPKELEISDKKPLCCKPIKLIEPKYDDQVGLTLTPIVPNQHPEVKQCFIRVAKTITMASIKKYLSDKLFNTDERFRDIDLLYHENRIGPDHMLIFVMVTNIANYREVKTVEFKYRLRNPRTL